MKSELTRGELVEKLRALIDDAERGRVLLPIADQLATALGWVLTHHSLSCGMDRCKGNQQLGQPPAPPEQVQQANRILNQYREVQERLDE